MGDGVLMGVRCVIRGWFFLCVIWFKFVLGLCLLYKICSLNKHLFLAFFGVCLFVCSFCCFWLFCFVFLGGVLFCVGDWFQDSTG